MILKEEIYKFLSKCKYFVNDNGLYYFEGNFDIDFIAVNKMLKYSNISGRNILNEYVELIHLSWEKKDDGFYLEQDKIDKLNNHISLFRELKIIDIDIIRDCLFILKSYQKKLIKHKLHISKEPRRKAQIFISKKQIRSIIFDVHGKLCLRCGSSENISLDHVIPISKYGKNELENLQPLCRNCNSWKGTKTIDFRKKILNINLIKI